MGIISTGPGSPLAFSSASGGKVYPYNGINPNTSTVVLPANPSRQSLTFHNPGPNDIFVYPQFQAAGSAIVASNAALGGTFRVFGNGGALTITGECQYVWFAFAVTGAGNTNPFTAMESNI